MTTFAPSNVFRAAYSLFLSNKYNVFLMFLTLWARSIFS